MTLIICPLKKELTALKESLQEIDYSFKVKNSGRGNIFIDYNNKVALAIGGHGKVGFALGVVSAIQSLSQISAVICAGTAGGIEPEVRPLDVIVGKWTVEHDYKEKFEPRPAPRFAANLNLLEKLTIHDQGKFKNFKLFIGSIASGDEDIVDPKRARELWEQEKVHCVAWEGAGGARAAQQYQLPYIEIRGVSDVCNSDTQRHFMENLPQAMRHVGQVVDLLIETHSH